MRRSNLLLLSVVLCALLATAVGCAAKDTDPVSVAQVAVRANPDLELLATDAQQGVLTVRIKRNARVVTVRAADVVAGTAFRDVDMSAGALVEPPASTAAVEPQTQVAAAPHVAPPAAAPAVQKKSAPPAAPAASAEPPMPRPSPADAPAGVSSAAQPMGSVADGATLDESGLEKRTRPVQCVGTETVRLDHVLLQTDGVAVQAVGRCRVYIANSKLVARVAVMVAGNATLTVENSILEGPVALDAAGASVSSVRSSTIEGRVQKLGNAVVRDLGHNVWR